MNTFFAFLFGITAILAFLFFFRNNLLRSQIQTYFDRRIAPQHSTLLTSVFQGLMNLSAGDMGNVIYKGFGLVLAIAALFFLTKALRMNINS